MTNPHLPGPERSEETTPGETNLSGTPKAAEPVGAYSAAGRRRKRRGGLAWLPWLLIGLLLLSLLAVALVVRHYADSDTDDARPSASALVIDGQPTAEAP